MELRLDKLYIPVKLGTEEKYLEIYAAGKKIYEFKIPQGNSEAFSAEEFDYDYIARIGMKEHLGKTISFEGDFSKGFFEAVEMVNNEKHCCTNSGQNSANDTHMERRPKVHFTPEYGWMNDPNGLVYSDGIYHLYYQHNPFNIHWENMSWGHATSKDMLTWEWHNDVMFPDENGTIFSGCGISFEGKLLFPYTIAGDTSPWSKEKPFCQGLAISEDGGMTLKKQEDLFLGPVGKDSRDPKVFWHEESKAYVMILYLEENDFGIFRSPDLKEWTQTQRFSVEKAWECPDLLKIPCVNGEDAWMFWCADGFYYWGSFDGYEFVSDFRQHQAYFGGNLYATQTYSGIEDRVVAIPWLRFKKRNGKCYQGALGIPKEYTCRRDGDDIVLLQNDIREFTDKLVPAQMKSQYVQFIKSADAVTERTLPMSDVQVIDIDFQRCDFGKIIELDINQTKLCIDLGEGKLRLGDIVDDIPPNVKKMHMVVDANILEINFDDSIVGAYVI